MTLIFAIQLTYNGPIYKCIIPNNVHKPNNGLPCKHFNVKASSGSNVNYVTDTDHWFFRSIFFRSLLKHDINVSVGQVVF